MGSSKAGSNRSVAEAETLRVTGHDVLGAGFSTGAVLVFDKRHRFILCSVVLHHGESGEHMVEGVENLQ
jgi:hypothetical protein